MRPVEDVAGVGVELVAEGVEGVVAGGVVVGDVCVPVAPVLGVDAGLGCVRGGGGFGAATGAGSGGGGSGVVAVGRGGGGSLATDAGAGGVSTAGSVAASSDEPPLRNMKKAIVGPPMTTKAPIPISASVRPELFGRGRAAIGAAYIGALPGAWGAPWYPGAPAAPGPPGAPNGEPPYGLAGGCAGCP
ncbi:hypothetical protein WME91_49050 [Sorangium sp. So ce269]